MSCSLMFSVYWSTCTCCQMLRIQSAFSWWAQRHSVAVHDQQALALHRMDLRGVAAGRSTCILGVSHTCSIDFRYPETPVGLFCLYDLSSLRCTKAEVELVLLDRQGVTPMSSSVGLTRIKHLLPSWTRLVVGNASQNHRFIQKYNCRTFC